jgi:hypothetical protein
MYGHKLFTQPAEEWSLCRIFNGIRSYKAGSRDSVRVNEKQSGLNIIFVALFGNRTDAFLNSNQVDSHIKVTSFWRQEKERK